MEVRLEKVTKKYDLDTLGVEDITLNAENCVYGIIGDAGSGKTTLLYLIGGIVDIDGGELIFDGKAVNRVPPKERDAVLIGRVCPQRGSVEKVLSYGLKLRRYPRAEIKRRAAEAAAMFGFAGREKENARKLGAVDRVRLGLARAAARKAAVVLIDEPYAAVGEDERTALYADIKRLAAYTGGTVFVASSNGADAEYVGDRLSVLRGGRIIRTGTFGEISRDPRTAYVARFVGEMPVNILRKEDGVYAVRADRMRLTDGEGEIVGVKENEWGSEVALRVAENEPPLIIYTDKKGLKTGDRAGYETVSAVRLTEEAQDER